MTIDDRLAFGEYVSLPIRTEKTAEEKWNELQNYIEERHTKLMHCIETAWEHNETVTALRYCSRRMELQYVAEKMDELDT